jgi:hypothetical protein
LNSLEASQGGGEIRRQRASVGVVDIIKGQSVANAKETESKEDLLPQDMGPFCPFSRKDSCHFIPIVEGLNEWQGVLFILEVEASRQELGVLSFFNLKDNCSIKLLSLTSQLKDRTYLVSRGESKLQVLQCETQNLENQFTQLKVELEP